jgi:hypothetical protein
MQTLKLYRRAAWYMDFIKQSSPKMYEEEKDKLYTCLGEFAHAPGHHLMCEFGTWKLSGMHELDNFDELVEHPDDVTITL